MKLNFVHLLGALSSKNVGIAIRNGISALMAFMTIAATASTVQFKPAQSYAVGDNPIAVVTADFNKDGNPDLAVLNSGSNSVTILLGKADGTFQSVGSFPAAIPANSLRPSIAVGDFNGDGKMDVAVHMPPNFTSYPGEVHILLGNGDGTLQAPILTILDFGQAVAGVADLNGDKKADLIMNLSDSNNAATGVAVLLGKGDGSFQPSKTVMSGPWTALTVADLNADGKLDLAIGNSSTVQIMLGSGDGTFSQGPQAVLKDGYIASAAWARDLNGDGRVDLIVGSSLSVKSECGGIIKFPCWITTVRASVLLGGNEGTLEGERVVVSETDLDNDVAPGDFNGDGKLDLAMTASTPYSLSLYPGDEDGTFGAVVSMPVPGPLSMAVDFNGDQLADLAILDSANNSVDVLLNATPAFSMSASTNILAANAGQQVTDTFSFTGVNGFSSTLQLSCQVVGPAPVPTCSLSPASIAGGASTSTSTLTVSVPATSARLDSPQGGLRLQPLYALALPFAFVGVGFRRKGLDSRYKRWLLTTSLATAALLCTACGGGNSNAQSVRQATSYTVQMTAASDSLTKAMQISLTVQ